MRLPPRKPAKIRAAFAKRRGFAQDYQPAHFLNSPRTPEQREE
jgi:hypothetical protein